eukprot:CAMPEP_0182428082 /NCGR_PEP_ID=MMETSP1167-20130531/21007_1 /TAXON_ID=2988 /ORGANISM="Mallomonas Sp, Strain CCMP3275" /LENGTH=403 /DNA_ID=CAMNT_0024610743 /DNA_START=34 /DNA_END=1246 /DNA_ORIENTATION=-
MQHIHNISIKSEFSVASDDEGLLPKGEMNLRLGSQLTCSSLTDSLHGIYQDIPQNNLLLPSLQSLPTLSQSFTSTSAPIIKKEKQDHDQSSLPDIQYPLSSAPDHLNSSLLSSSHDCGSILNDESWLKGQNNAEQSGRLSPTSVSERSIPMYKNDNSFCSLEEITESSNEISDHDIDFDSVYEVLDTENIENILEKNYIPFSLPSMPSPVDITDSLSLLSAPTDSTLIKRSRSVVEEDNLGYTSCMNIKRSRRLNSLVPVPRKSRPAEYQCSKCSENYEITVEENSWWAIYVQECPHCNELQIPRIDINSSINAIESDPNMIALYGDGSGDSDDDEGEGGFDYGSDEDETDVLLPLNQINFFPFGGEGELTIEEATQLIPLMSMQECVTDNTSRKTELKFVIV